jgi:hypothetical protein
MASTKANLGPEPESMSYKVIPVEEQALHKRCCKKLANIRHYYSAFSP